MKKCLKVILPAFLLVFYSSCEKDFIIPDSESDSKIVVNCQFDNQRYFKVYLTESSSAIITSKLKSISDATVELFKNDSLLKVLPFVFTDSAETFGCYQLTENPVPGNNYSVRIIHPKYGVVTAEDVLPDLTEVSSHQMIHYGDSTSNYRTHFRLQFQDDGSQENFYRINIWQWGKSIRYINYNLGDTLLQNYGYSSRPEVSSPLYDTVRDFGTYLLFSDRGFNGQMKEIDMQFRTIGLHNVVEGNLLVELTSVSRANYEYFRSLEQYRNITSGYEPVAVSDNIHNGYGIFMGEAIYSMWNHIK